MNVFTGICFALLIGLDLTLAAGAASNHRWSLTFAYLSIAAFAAMTVARFFLREFC